MSDFPIGFGRYQLVERLAMGGMAELFVATSPGEHGFQKKVVIKRLLPHLVADETYNAMFIDEAKLTARLVHPKIAQTFELGKVDDQLYIAMEYIDGIDVLALLREFAGRRRRVEPQLAAWIAHEVLDALDYAHNVAEDNGSALGIVHRDISPSNVLLSLRGDIKLVDFGIARAKDPGRAHKSKSGTLKGKYGYMSPEQVVEQPLDHRSDLFSVGVVLAELLTGRRLFAAANELDVLLMVRDAKLSRFDKYGHDINPGLADIVRKALRKSVDDRWASAAAFRDGLAEWLFEQRHRITNKQIADVVGDLRESVLARRSQQLGDSASTPVAQQPVQTEQPVRSRSPSDDGVPVMTVDGGDSMPVISVSYDAGDRAVAQRPVSVSDLASSATPAPPTRRPESTPPSRPAPTTQPRVVQPAPTVSTQSTPPPRSHTVPRQNVSAQTQPPPAPPSAAPIAAQSNTGTAPIVGRSATVTRTPLTPAVNVGRVQTKVPPLNPHTLPTQPIQTLPGDEPQARVETAPFAARTLSRDTTPTVPGMPPLSQSRTATGSRSGLGLAPMDEAEDDGSPGSITAAVEAIVPRTSTSHTSGVHDFDELTADALAARAEIDATSREEAMRKRPPTPPALSDIAEPPDDSGDFSTTSPLRVLFRLMTARSTGLLVVAVGGIKKEIYVRDGQPEYVSSNVASELFGNYLVTKGVLSDGELAMALAMMPHYGGKLGDTLVGLGLLKPLEVFRHLTRQVRTKIIDVCTWGKGGFGWYAGRENPREAFPLDFNAFEILGAGAMALSDETTESWVARNSGLRLRASRTRRVGPERFEVKGLVELFDSLDGKRAIGDIVELHFERADRLKIGRMLCLLESCDLARPG